MTTNTARTVTTNVAIKRSQILPSFFEYKTDTSRCEAQALSRRHGYWYLVTLDGNRWFTSAHLPENYKQAVGYTSGNFTGAIQQQ